MKLIFFILRFLFVAFLTLLIYFLIINFFNPIFEATSLIFPYAIHPFDICTKIPTAWFYIKLSFKLTLIYNLFTFMYSFLSSFFPNKCKPKNKKTNQRSPKVFVYMLEIISKARLPFILMKKVYIKIY